MQADSKVAAVRLSPAEQAAWELEEAYWRFVKQKEWESYADLWDERFAGWPRHEPVPVHKSNVRGAWKRNVLDYRLEPLSVREYGGNVVIAFYRATMRSTDAKGEDERTQTLRITHTWMNTAEGWKIISGMAAEDKPGGPD